MSTAFSNFCVLATAGYTGRESLETQPEKLEAFTAAVGDEGSPNDAMQVVLENTPRVSARAKEAWALHVNEAYAFMSNPDNTVNPKYQRWRRYWSTETTLEDLSKYTKTTLAPCVAGCFPSTVEKTPVPEEVAEAPPAPLQSRLATAIHSDLRARVMNTGSVAGKTRRVRGLSDTINAFQREWVAMHSSIRQ